MKRFRFSTLALLIASAALALAPVAGATVGYTPVTGGTPGLGPGVAPPSIVPGKEYSHNFDESTLGGGGVFDPEQIIAWDGIGGAADGLDFTGTRPSFTPDSEIDALANHGDHLYGRILSDEAHLVFSIDDMFTGYSFGAPFAGFVPSAGPVMLANGNLIGGAGELSVELGVMGVSAGNPLDTQMLWAPQPAINAMPFPIDVDGVELWGPEPGFAADTDKYSLDTDILSFSPAGGGGPIPGDAVSVWNGSGSPYIAHSTIAIAVSTLLGPDSAGGIPFQQINLDALMVQDTVGSSDEFERDPTGGPGTDSIIFSIEQIIDPGDPDGYYATGSELFVLDASGSITFLAHGGHLWDHAYSLAVFEIFLTDDNNYAVIDINAIEAVSEGVVPEPSGLALLSLGMGLMGWRRRRSSV
ncbi:PEP-CTERM sorting domain-containing protein [Phycisphaeraceae bacterium D3-23]